MGWSKWKWAVGFVFLWFIAIGIIYYDQISLSSAPSESTQLNEQLKLAMQQISDLKEKLKRSQPGSSQKELSDLGKEVATDLESIKREKPLCLNEVKKLMASSNQNGVPGEGPSLEHELARFKLTNNIQELYYYMRSQLRGSVERPKEILEDFSERLRSIQVDLINLKGTDNNEAWRQKEHEKLQDLMQRRLHYLQNPSDCKTAKKLVCDLNKGCGYGCQLHHAVYCFMIAYGTERTMILKSKGWRYSNKGWETVFLPLSDTCTDEGSNGGSSHNWAGEAASRDHQVVVMPIVDALSKRPPYMPLSFPEDLAPRLRRLTDDPSVWFIAQFVKYMMRPQPALQEDLNKVKDDLKFKTPIVGIHVRRTDKVGTEAAFHGIEEYMEHVEEWFKLQERIPGRIDKRRVYLASDDPKVLPDAIQKYPEYEFFGDTSIAMSAGMSSRYSDASLRGVILDIHFLSLTDYLVCTFSSQVCRVAYEIMQTLHPDPSRWFHSLDDIYYFGGQGGHEETALYKHVAKNKDEIGFEPGDTIGIAGNHWDGYSMGSNKRVGGRGLYPSYKTEDKKVIVKYPTYPQVPLTET